MNNIKVVLSDDDSKILREQIYSILSDEVNKFENDLQVNTLSLKSAGTESNFKKTTSIDTGLVRNQEIAINRCCFVGNCS